MDAETGLKVEIDPGLRADPELGPLAEHAAELLAEQAAGTFRPASASWWLTTDPKHGKRIHVKLFDEKCSVEVDYSPTELGPGGDTRYLMIRLWGDLLELRLRGLRHPAFLEAFRQLAGGGVG
jgi:hypothetical protein